LETVAEPAETDCRHLRATQFNPDADYSGRDIAIGPTGMGYFPHSEKWLGVFCLPFA